jgi:hypothetical protein
LLVKLYPHTRFLSLIIDLKEDWCNVPSDYQNAAGSQKLYARMRDALKTATSKTGRPIVFSLCNWGNFTVSQWGIPLAICGAPEVTSLREKRRKSDTDYKVSRLKLS